MTLIYNQRSYNYYIFMYIYKWEMDIHLQFAYMLS